MKTKLFRNAAAGLGIVTVGAMLTGCNEPAPVAASGNVYSEGSYGHGHANSFTKLDGMLGKRFDRIEGTIAADKLNQKLAQAATLLATQDSKIAERLCAISGLGIKDIIDPATGLKIGIRFCETNTPSLER